MIVPSVKELAKFAPEKFSAVGLNQTERSKTMVVAFEPGQAIPVHHPKSDITLVILEGEATLVSGDKDLEKAGPGAVLLSQAGEARGIRADVRTIALVVVSPPPTQEDHKEMFEHFKKGTWR